MMNTDVQPKESNPPVWVPLEGRERITLLRADKSDPAGVIDLVYIARNGELTPLTGQAMPNDPQGELEWLCERIWVLVNHARKNG